MSETLIGVNTSFTESNGLYSITFKLYGPVTVERDHAERRIARHRLEQLSYVRTKMPERRNTYDQDRTLRALFGDDRHSFGPGGY